MSKLPQSPGSGAPQSAGRGRNLYLVEILLGAGLLLLVGFIVLSGNPRKGGDAAEDDGATHGNLVTLTAANWDREVTNSKVPVLVDFWAPWCGPCRMLSPVIDRIADRYAGKVKVAKLNIDKAPSIQARFGINSIPQVFLFHGEAQPRPLAVNAGDLAGSEALIAEELNHVLQ